MGPKIGQNGTDRTARLAPLQDRHGDVVEVIGQRGHVGHDVDRGQRTAVVGGIVAAKTKYVPCLFISF